MKRFTAALCAATVLTLASPAAATTFVDTGVQTGNNGGGPTLSTTQYLAGRFTLTSASVLTDLQGYIASLTADTIRVSLRANVGNLPGSTPLYSATFTALAGGIGGAWQGVSGQSWAVNAGTYWISFDDLTGPNAFMPASAPSPLAAYAASGDQGATWGVLSNRPLGVRISGNAGTPAVPEPATWSLMIVGFGAVGIVARRRKARAALPA